MAQDVTGYQSFSNPAAEEEERKAREEQAAMEALQQESVDPNQSAAIEQEKLAQQAKYQKALSNISEGYLVSRDSDLAKEALADPDIGGGAPGGYATDKDATAAVQAMLQNKLGVAEQGQPQGQEQPQAQQQIQGIDPRQLKPYVPGEEQLPQEIALQQSIGTPGRFHLPGVGKLSKAVDDLYANAKIFGQQVQKGQEAVRAASDKYGKSSINLVEAQVNAAEDQADILKTSYAATQKIKNEMAERKAKAKQEADASYRAYQDELRRQQEQPEEKIEFGIGRRIAAGIAMALGAIGSAYTGGPNQAMQIVKMGMDREAEDYRRRMASRQRKLGQKKTLYDMAKNHYTDVESQILAAQTEILERAKLEASVKMAESKSPIAKANGQKFIDGLNLELTSKQAKLNDREISKKMALDLSAFGAQKSVTEMKQKKSILEQQQKMTISQALAKRKESAKKFIEKERKLAIRGLQRDYRYEPSVKAKEEVEKRFGSYNTIQQNINELKNIRKKITPGLSNATISKLYARGAEVARRTLKNAVAFDISGANLTMMETVISGFAEKNGDIYDVGKIGYVLEELSTLQRLMRQEMQNKLPSGYVMPTAEMRKKTQTVSKGY